MALMSIAQLFARIEPPKKDDMLPPGRSDVSLQLLASAVTKSKNQKQ